MGNDFHKNLLDDDNHALTARTYADLTARDDDTVFHSTANLNKLVRVDSPVSYYILESTTPSWLELSNETGDEFIELFDTPASYSGQAGNVLQVSVSENAVEFGQGLRPTDDPAFGILQLDQLSVTNAGGGGQPTLTSNSASTILELLGGLDILSGLRLSDSVSVGGLTDPAGNASIDLKSTSQVFYLNPLTTAVRDSIVPDRAGAMVWDTDLAQAVNWDGTSWNATSGGDLSGPPSATDNALMRFDGTTGKNAQNSLAILDDLGNLDLTSADAAYETGGNPILFANTTEFNTLVGVGAGGGPAIASFRNVAVGYQALLNIVSGNEHTAIGYQALLSTADGFFNTAIGFQALTANIDGTSNTAIGHLALASNVTGGRNIAIGQDALRNNVDGEDNVAIGSGALLDNVSGDNNLAMGFQALRENLSFFNVAVGPEALRDHITGNSSTAFGRRAGRFIADGSTPNTQSVESLFLGAEARSLDDTVTTNEIVIGFQAIGRGSNTIVLGNDSIANTSLKGNVGAGTVPTPARLTVGTAVPADGDELVRFATERPWAFEQEGTGSATNLRLRNTSGPNKAFFIDTDGLSQWRSVDGATGFMVLSHGTGALGIGPFSADASSLFDVQSTIKGALPAPRMTTVQKDAIASPLTALLAFDNTIGRYEFFDGAQWKGLEEAALNIVYFTEESQLPAPVSGQIPLAANTTYCLYNDDPSASQKAVTIANELLFPDAGGCRITSIGLATALLIYTGTGTFLNSTSSFTGFIHIDELFLSCPNGTLFNIDGVLPIGSEFFPRLFMSHMGVFDTNTLGTIKTISINFNVGAFFDCGQGLILDHLDEALIGDWRFANWKNGAGSVFVTARNQLRFPQIASCTIETGSNETAFNIEPSIGDATFLITGNTYGGSGAAYATGVSGTIDDFEDASQVGTITAVSGTPFGESIMTEVGHGLVVGQIIDTGSTFTVTAYNGIFEILEIIDVDDFRVHAAFSVTDSGSYTSDILRIESIVHGRAVGDGITVATADFSLGYNKGYRVLAVQANFIFVNGVFTAPASGTWNTDSLDQTEEPLLVVANAGLPSSAATFLGALNDNTTATTITDGVYAGTNWTGLIAPSAQRFELTDPSIGLWTYTGKTPSAGLFISNPSMTKSGAVAEYRFALSINGAIPVFASAFHFKAAVSSTRSQISLGLPTGVLNTGDTVQIMAAGDGTGDAMTITDGNQFLAITES